MVWRVGVRFCVARVDDVSSGVLLIERVSAENVA